MPEPEDIQAEETATVPEVEDIEVVPHGQPDESYINDPLCYTNNG